jgi:hypothetical protein
MNLLEPYQQAYTYDTGNNLTNLSHQANSSAWQQILTIFVVLLGWLKGLVKAGSLFDFVFGG